MCSCRFFPPESRMFPWRVTARLQHPASANENNLVRRLLLTAWYADYCTTDRVEIAKGLHAGESGHFWVNQAMLFVKLPHLVNVDWALHGLSLRLVQSGSRTWSVTTTTIHQPTSSIHPSKVKSRSQTSEAQLPRRSTLWRKPSPNYRRIRNSLPPPLQPDLRVRPVVAKCPEWAHTKRAVDS